MKTSKVIKIIWWLAIAAVFACALGNIIAVNTGSCVPTKSSETVWCFNLILWVGIFLMANRSAEFWKEHYDLLSNEYNKLLLMSKEINDISMKQNEICREVQANNKELSAGWRKALDENKKLIDERQDLLLTLAEFDPQDPVVKALLKKLNGDTEKEAPSTNPE